MDVKTVVEEARRIQLPPPSERRRIRKAAKLTLKDIAKALGVTEAAVHHWETENRYPRRATAIAYAELLRDLERIGFEGG